MVKKLKTHLVYVEHFTNAVHNFKITHLKWIYLRYTNEFSQEVLVSGNIRGGGEYKYNLNLTVAH